nr:unnamed protein product [Digitaria exilis]
MSDADEPRRGQEVEASLSPGESQKSDSMAAKMDGAVQVLKDDTVKRTPMARPSIGHEGKPIRLLSNHFAVKLRRVDAIFYQYSVSIKSEDDKVVDGKDVSTTMIVTPGPVIDFLLTNQNVRDIRDIDWPRAKKMLKNLRVKAKHNNMEFKIIGLSDQACSKQTFPMKVRNGSIEVQTVDITVQDYFKSKQLVVGNSEDCIPNRGRWNYNNKFIERPYTLVDEDSQSRRCLPVERVERMFEKVKMSLPGPPEFLLCVLPERKNCDIYGPWKKKNLHEEGIVTQCIAPSNKMNDQYFTNVLLKINAKLGGMNSKLALEHRQMIPVVTQVVGSRCWPLISRYRASVRTQSPKVEMIDSLFKPLDDGKDDGIMRDGVSESQFSQAYQSMGQGDLPKFTVIIAQKNHHTKLFQADSPDNVPPGTVVDSGIVHPRQYDFYMCAHAGPIGTSRPTHYHVLLDEIGFSADNLQKLVLSLSYVYQRSTTAISVVAPICYAHLAAAQMGQFMKFEDFADTSSGSGANSSSSAAIPELPRLHADVCSSMFFC